QGLSLDEEQKLLEWNRLRSEKGESDSATVAAQRAYDQARARNAIEMNENNAIAWLKEGQYVARGGGGKDAKWSINANINAVDAQGNPRGTGGYVPVDRQYSVLGQYKQKEKDKDKDQDGKWKEDALHGKIEPGERDIPSTAIGTQVLIHSGVVANYDAA